MKVDASNCYCRAANRSNAEARSGEMEGATETAAKGREPNDSSDDGPKRLANDGPDGLDGARAPLSVRDENLSRRMSQAQRETTARRASTTRVRAETMGLVSANDCDRGKRPGTLPL